MPLDLFLLRHGETDWNRAQRFCGHSDVPLNEAGRAMATAFCQAYRGLRWTALYASNAQRAIATAEPLAHVLGLPVVTVPALRELSYGEWEGLTRAEIGARWPTLFERWLEDPSLVAPSGGETATQVAARAVPALRDITQAHSDGRVLVVCHKSTLRILVLSLLGLEVRVFRERVAQPSGGVTRFTVGPGGVRLECLGDRAHLTTEFRTSEDR